MLKNYCSLRWISLNWGRPEFLQNFDKSIITFIQSLFVGAACFRRCPDGRPLFDSLSDSCFLWGNVPIAGASMGIVRHRSVVDALPTKKPGLQMTGDAINGIKPGQSETRPQFSYCVPWWIPVNLLSDLLSNLCHGLICHSLLNP